MQHSSFIWLIKSFMIPLPLWWLIDPTIPIFKSFLIGTRMVVSKTFFGVWGLTIIESGEIWVWARSKSFLVASLKHNILSASDKTPNHSCRHFSISLVSESEINPYEFLGRHFEHTDGSGKSQNFPSEFSMKWEGQIEYSSWIAIERLAFALRKKPLRLLRNVSGFGKDTKLFKNTFLTTDLSRNQKSCW